MGYDHLNLTSTINTESLFLENGPNRDCSVQSASFIMNPTGFGTRNFTLAKTNIHVNNQTAYVQPSCEMNPSPVCSHKYPQCIAPIIAFCGYFTDDQGNLTVKLEPDVIPSSGNHNLATKQKCLNCTALITCSKTDSTTPPSA